MSAMEAALALVVCAFMAGFVGGSVFEADEAGGTGRWGLLFLVFAICAGLMLVGDGPIRPLWLEYLILGAVPLGAGLLTRWLLGRSLAGRSK